MILSLMYLPFNMDRDIPRIHTIPPLRFNKHGHTNHKGDCLGTCYIKKALPKKLSSKTVRCSAPPA